MTGNEEQKSAAWWSKFQSLLDEQNAWPAEYVFKFIVPAARLDEVRHLFGQAPLMERASRNGNYVSITATMLIYSSDEIVAMYSTAAKIEGLIAL